MPHPNEFKTLGHCDGWTMRWRWVDGHNLTITNLTQPNFDYFGRLSFTDQSSFH